LIGVTEVWLRY